MLSLDGKQILANFKNIIPSTVWVKSVKVSNQSHWLKLEVMKVFKLKNSQKRVTRFSQMYCHKLNHGPRNMIVQKPFQMNQFPITTILEILKAMISQMASEIKVTVVPVIL